MAFNFLGILTNVSKPFFFSFLPNFQMLTVDLAFVLEGQTQAELPERLLAVVRLHELSMSLSPTITQWEESIATKKPTWLGGGGEKEQESDDDNSYKGIVAGSSYLIDV